MYIKCTPSKKRVQTDRQKSEYSNVYKVERMMKVSGKGDVGEKTTAS